MNNEERKAQTVKVLEVSLTNLQVVLDQVESVADHTDISEVVRGIKHARTVIKQRIEGLHA